jgi:type VI secretion system protein ImpF
MADLAPQERLLPFLLDRLTDEDPQTRVEGRERRAISFRAFHKAILRDLQWLLNTASKAEKDNLQEFPEVAKSVVNFGMPDIAGNTESSMTAQQVERMVRQAIIQFEPRIIKNSLQVRAIESSKVVGNVLAIEIRGQVWAQPMPESLYVKTEVDLETGMCNLQDQLHG